MVGRRSSDGRLRGGLIIVALIELIDGLIIVALIIVTLIELTDGLIIVALIIVALIIVTLIELIDGLIIVALIIVALITVTLIELIDGLIDLPAIQPRPKSFTQSEMRPCLADFATDRAALNQILFRVVQRRLLESRQVHQIPFRITQLVRPMRTVEFARQRHYQYSCRRRIFFAYHLAVQLPI